MVVCCSLLLADFVAFLFSFGHSFETEAPASWNVWLNTILFYAGVVLLGLSVLGVVVGPFAERRRESDERASPATG